MVVELSTLSQHDQNIIEKLHSYLTQGSGEVCGCCGVAHEVLEMLVAMALEEQDSNPAHDAEKLLSETFTAAIAFQQTTPGIRTFHHPTESDEGYPFYAHCETCNSFHPMLDVLALVVLCGLKTQQELEEGFAHNFVLYGNQSNNKQNQNRA